MTKPSNPTDDPMARTYAENTIYQLLPDMAEDDARAIARVLITAFPYVAFETATSKLPGGQTVHLRRLVLTGEWEVDAAAVNAQAFGVTPQGNGAAGRSGE